MKTTSHVIERAVSALAQGRITGAEFSRLTAHYIPADAVRTAPPMVAVIVPLQDRFVIFNEHGAVSEVPR